jgi:hypothetical protein
MKITEKEPNDMKMTRTITNLALFAILYSLSSLWLSGCANMTPEQQAQWSATGQAFVQQASTIALDEAAVRLRNSRKLSDNK